MGQERHACRGVNEPVQTIQHVPLHFLNVFRAELAPAQICQCGQFDFSEFMSLDGNVQCCERGKQRRIPGAPIPSRGQESIKKRHAHGDDLSRQIKVVDHVEAPVTNLLSPRGVEQGGGIVVSHEGRAG